SPLAAITAPGVNLLPSPPAPLPKERGDTSSSRKSSAMRSQPAGHTQTVVTCSDPPAHADGPPTLCSMFALACFRHVQFDIRGVFEVDRVAFVGVEVNFEFDVVAGANDEVFQHCRAALALDPQVDFVAVFTAVVCKIGGAHMHMPHC